MGSSFSASTTPAAAATSTSSAKVITISGTLKEYSCAPIPASIVLDDIQKPAEAAESESCPIVFLCNADALVFDAPVSALAPQDLLLPGRLYFVLPEGMKRRPLSGADMGALAVRASKALEAAAGRGGRRGKKKGRALKVSPIVDVIIGKDAYLDDGCGADRHRSTAVVSSATRMAPAPLKKSTAAAGAGAGQRRGSNRSGRFARRGGSFRGRLNTIEEDAE